MKIAPTNYSYVNQKNNNSPAFGKLNVKMSKSVICEVAARLTLDQASSIEPMVANLETKNGQDMLAKMDTIYCTDKEGKKGLYQIKVTLKGEGKSTVGFIDAGSKYPDGSILKFNGTDFFESAKDSFKLMIEDLNKKIKSNEQKECESLLKEKFGMKS